jgi:hypothetical protein
VQAKTLGILSVEAPPLRLTVEGMPAAGCARNHSSPVDGNFMLWLIQELKARAGSLPAAEEKGAIFKKFLCACGRELASKPQRKQAFPFELAYPDYPGFKAALEMPLYKCTGCGKEQVRSAKEAQKHTSQAIAELNDAAGFPHT